MRMNIRKNPLPQKWWEILLYLSIGLLVPVGLLYEFLVVVPEVHKSGSYSYCISIIFAMYILFNVEVNLIACMVIDTSVRADSIRPPPVGSAEHSQWHHCDLCNRLAPPRSWHCNVCGVCILKRDHHCGFIGYCIGHQNHRYFICLISYLLILSIYGIIYNYIYIWKFYLPQLLIPFQYFVMDMFFSAFLTLNIILFILSCMAVSIYVPKLLAGKVALEGRKHPNLYDNGVYDNLRIVFGQHMWLAWIFPFARSQLPKDGYSWQQQTCEEIKVK